MAPRETESNGYAKFWGDKERALWYVMVFSGVVNNQSLIPSTDVKQLTLTLKMTTAQVVETSVTINNSSPIQDYVHPDDHTQLTY